MADSKKLLFGFFILLFAISTFYYPKWNKPHTEATISWDVSGYYFYLPSFLIYKDLKQLKFSEQIIQSYHPSPQMDQAYLHESGNYVMKYSVGMALMYLPFFLLGHLFALISHFEADGFSIPYQFSIFYGSLLVCFLGLWYLRKILIQHFRDKIVSLVLAGIVLGTNYLNYSCIDSAMPHNYLFTVYALTIWTSIKFNKNPSSKYAILIGCFVGLATLSRPTEIIIVLIPLLWGATSLKQRLEFLQKNKRHVLTAAIIVFCFGLIQLTYWKYTTGSWMVYSYQDQGFSWTSPHIKDGLISAKAGWLIYSPIMIFSLLGFWWTKIYRNPLAFCLGFTLLFLYITWSWDIWWYGGGLGQRAIIQAYPILAFPMGFFFTKTLKSNWIKWSISLFFSAFVFYNLWLTHQAHLGGLLRTGQMTKAYLTHILFKTSVDQESEKLLDTNEWFRGELKDFRVLKVENFEEQKWASDCTALDGNNSLCVTGDVEYSQIVDVEAKGLEYSWIRARANFVTKIKEHDIWKMTQFTIQLKQDEKIVKRKMIRVQRTLNENTAKELSLDIRVPSKPFNQIEVYFWNPGSTTSLIVDNLEISAFNP